MSGLLDGELLGWHRPGGVSHVRSPWRGRLEAAVRGAEAVRTESCRTWVACAVQLIEVGYTITDVWIHLAPFVNRGKNFC